MMVMRKKPSEDEPKEEKKKLSLRTLLVIGLVVLVVFGGGFFVYKTYISEMLAERAARRAAAPVLYSMSNILVNLSDAGGKRYLKVNLELQLEDQAVIDELKTYNHAVRDTVILLLSGKVYDDISSPAGKLTLKREIITRLNRILTKGEVKDVYFTEFLVQ